MKFYKVTTYYKSGAKRRFYCRFNLSDVLFIFHQLNKKDVDSVKVEVVYEED